MLQREKLLEEAERLRQEEISKLEQVQENAIKIGDDKIFEQAEEEKKTIITTPTEALLPANPSPDLTKSMHRNAMGTISEKMIIKSFIITDVVMFLTWLFETGKSGFISVDSKTINAVKKYLIDTKNDGLKVDRIPGVEFARGWDSTSKKRPYKEE